METLEKPSVESLGVGSGVAKVESSLARSAWKFGKRSVPSSGGLRV